MDYWLPRCIRISSGMLTFKTVLLFAHTVLAEITGCHLSYRWLRMGDSVWLLAPAAASLTLFAWLLIMYPAASGGVYAAYGCVYVVAALPWPKVVDGAPPSATDIAGGAAALLGMLVIISGWGNTSP